ncbi:thiamine pyrophosphate-dependent dehydrogenase E1 component subunit alpha [Reinekea blandensis]|uniref:2-oxoisovalerate dehydrogenase subunit alpha n=1 Tax=Reinekea blandensis MED297 TaxID=314283 RepID=A4B8T4_9GAMM|nr:thiamine pyrophosphate-dependent dehydrogenase E1 component subunit alpha [Reinekea blandensis]EAR11035.1 2-oxoisovalerate dehydrogenase complex, E1 component, alpha subunit [Reinekea sp. MED297] [Reinekea blandensis MED297]
MSQSTVHKPELMDENLLSIPTFKLLKQDGTLYQGASAPDFSEDFAVKVYQDLVFTRVLDERMINAQRQGRIPFYLASLGEEAASVGSAAALSDHDMIFAQYREQGALRLRGFTAQQFMDQCFSNELDLGKGRQMPIHYGSKALNYMTISSPLATQIPQAAGYAYGQKLAGLDAVTICYFGEGAASEGDFHAGVNMAAVLNCPTLFLCRNNGYAISTPADEQFKGDGVASRGIGYGIKTIRVDGNDLLAMYEATRIARDYALENNAPVLIEAMSYRLGAHSTSDDPTGYRSKDEEAKWAKKDPVLRYKHWLTKQGWWDDDKEKALYAEYREDILSQMKAAEKRPVPTLDHLIEDVYDQPSDQLRKQLSELKQHIRQYPDNYPKTAGRLDA